MDNTAQAERRNSALLTGLGNLLVIAAWFGLLTGLLEGLTFLIFQRLGWLSWNMSLWGVSKEIIWIAPIFDLALFCLLGFLISALSLAFRPIRTMSVVVWLCVFLMTYDWLSLSGRIGHWGIYSLAAGLATVLAKPLGRSGPRALHFWRTTLPWLAGIAALAFIVIQGGSRVRERLTTAQLPEAAPGSPNILLIVVDTLRADHLSAYGYPRLTSPTVDRMAKEGILFENAIATASWTLPSHASFLTGRYVFEHGADRQVYDGRYPTIGQVLQTRGYRTAAFSANTDFFTRNQGFAPGFIHFDDFFSSFADAAMRTVYGRKFYSVVLSHLGFEDDPGRRRANNVTKSALSWIQHDSNKPFFAVLNYFDVHEPYLPPKPYRSKFSTFKNPGGIVNAWKFRTGRFNPPLTSAQVQSEMDAYDGGIALVDDSLSVLLDGLKNHQLAENTIVIFISDHGEEFQDHGFMGHKDDLYREEIHVPLIFSWAGHLPGGARISQPVSLSWLPATLMDLIGADKTIFPGPSLVELWKEPSAPGDWPHPLSELTRFDQKYARDDMMKSLVSSRWHFVTSRKQGPELYDWISDPLESRNIAETPEGEPVVRSFLNELQTVMARR